MDKGFSNKNKRRKLNNDETGNNDQISNSPTIFHNDDTLVYNVISNNLMDVGSTREVVSMHTQPNCSSIDCDTSTVYDVVIVLPKSYQPNNSKTYRPIPLNSSDVRQNSSLDDSHRRRDYNIKDSNDSSSNNVNLEDNDGLSYLNDVGSTRDGVSMQTPENYLFIDCDEYSSEDFSDNENLKNDELSDSRDVDSTREVVSMHTQPNRSSIDCDSSNDDNVEINLVNYAPINKHEIIAIINGVIGNHGCPTTELKNNFALQLSGCNIGYLSLTDKTTCLFPVYGKEVFEKVIITKLYIEHCLKIVEEPKLEKTLNFSIKLSDLLPVANVSGWFSEAVVNDYLKLIEQRSNNTIGVFTSFFYTEYIKEGYQGVGRWYKNIDIFSKEKIIIPIIHKNHWTLLCANMETRHLYYYDSYHKEIDLSFFKEYIALKYEFKFNQVCNWEWEVETGRRSPRQRNTYDCGVFVCINADFFARDIIPSQFKEEHSPILRQKILFELLTKKLCL